MNALDHDPLVGGLSRMAADAPADLLDRVLARWVRVPGPIDDLYVAFTDRGVCYVRPAGTLAGTAAGGAVAGDEPPASYDSYDVYEAFAESFRRRFGRPLLPAARPPAGVLPALRSGRAASLRFDLRGLSEFERAVLAAARSIPRGQIRPYAWVAARAGRPRAVRAAGSALARNPVPVLIPCHRVILSDGRPGDYVFGTATKVALLAAERVDLAGVRELAGRGVRYLASDTTGVVCLPTCHHARRITERHRQGFRTVAQAARAGYRPCADCQPGLAESA